MNLKTHILKVGRGDSIILELPNQAGKQVLCIIDCYQFDVADAYLKKYNFKPDVVKLVVATHPHLDHIQGLQRLLEKFQSDGVDVQMFWDSGFDHPTPNYEDLMSYLEGRSDIITMFPRSGTSVLFEDVEIQALSPPDPLIQNTESDCNNSSIVIQVRYGVARLLFGADAQFANWAHIGVNQCHNMRGQVLKVSHHGSKRGTFFEAIETLRPYYAIISGPHSKHDINAEHPHPITIDALEEYNVRSIHCTYDDGSIMVESRRNGTHSITPHR